MIKNTNYQLVDHVRHLKGEVFGFKSRAGQIECNIATGSPPQ